MWGCIILLGFNFSLHLNNFNLILHGNYDNICRKEKKKKDYDPGKKGTLKQFGC